jgi:hypothetical protein
MSHGRSTPFDSSDISREEKTHKIFSIARQVVINNCIKIAFYFPSPSELFLLNCIQMVIHTFKHNANIRRMHGMAVLIIESKKYF